MRRVSTRSLAIFTRQFAVLVDAGLPLVQCLELLGKDEPDTRLAEAIGQVIDRYPKLREVCWVQEEPENMGAWEFARPELETIINGRHPLRYIGRSRNSSPSEGSSSWHAANQRAIVDQVFEAKTEARDLDRVLSKQV